MPKLTITAEETGSSDAATIVLHKNKFGKTRQNLLDEVRAIRAGVEVLPTQMNEWALRRGTELEPAVAKLAQQELEKMTGGTVEMWEPRDAFRVKDKKIASSVDRIINLSQPLTLQGHTFVGEGLLEIKTDFYHQDKLVPDWAVQVHHQEICTGLDWGVVACFSQKGKLHFYPVPKNQALVDQMLQAYAEFWSMVDSGEDYPVSVTAPAPELVDITEMLPQTNQDVAQLCSDYLKASAEESAWKKTKAEVKDAIVVALDSLGVERAKLPGFEIKSVTVTKPKKEMVETGETYESLSFSVKEVSSE